ncbi:MAG: hypothetical protein COA85_07735 [Robiginitomaculum sp.]|nr:MAG: hypothetical protein COA85_07735 [Robiginitomaculum sp.]
MPAPFMMRCLAMALSLWPCWKPRLIAGLRRRKNQMNRYTKRFSISDVPSWMCPICESSTLSIDRQTFFRVETADSKKSTGHSDWEPDWLRFVYSCVFKCANKQCEGVVSSVGTGCLEEGLDEEFGQCFSEYFYPKYFYPNLKIFKLPEDTPSEIAEEINQSFSLFFCNFDSAANHARIALENILTDLKVKRYKIANHKRKTITLHNRIELLPAKYEKIKTLMLAVKWLGNSGSHSGRGLTPEDVIDAYKMLSVVLNAIYDDKHAEASKLAKGINKKKGPK